MIDTIWLILHHSTVNYKIDFMAEVGAKINVDIKRSNEYRIVGSLQNMQIYIEPTFVLIQGSLPKYYYGSNLVSLPRTELSNAIDKLSTDLGLPLREAIITRIDIGMNVEVDNPPRSYFSYFGILKKFERNIRRNSLYYEQKWCQLCFYDKVKEAKAHKDPLLTSEMLDKNILRYEIRYKHSWLKHYFKRNIKAKELFAKDPIVYLDLIAEWYLKYDDIIKIDIMKPKFEMTLMGLLRWELKDRSRKQDILKIIDSFSEKGDRKAARLKRVVTKMLNELFKDVKSVLGRFDRVVNGLRVKEENALKEIASDWTCTQEIADRFVLKGIDFRTGHGFASSLVTWARAYSKTPETTFYEEVCEIWKDFQKERAEMPFPLSEEEFKAALNPRAIVEGRQTAGSCSAEEVRKLLKTERNHIEDAASFVQRFTESQETFLKTLDQAAKEIGGGND